MSNATKMSARQRIEALVDENSFVEIGALVTKRNTDFNMQEKSVPGDGVITGYGLIDGSIVYVYSQDAAAMGGSVGEMHAQKICKMYDMAVKAGAPVIGLIDCAGIRLQEWQQMHSLDSEAFMLNRHRHQDLFLRFLLFLEHVVVE